MHPPPSYPCLFDLSSYQSLSISGEHAKKFLQGQLTCDVRDVNPSHMVSGALCNLKGRILTLMDVIEWEQLHLIFPTNLYEIVEKELRMSARLSRVTLKKENSLHCFGLYYPLSAAPLLPFSLPTHPSEFIHLEETGCYQLFPEYYMILTQHEDFSARTNLPLLPFSNWHHALLSHEIMQIYPETSGQFLPQPLNLDKKNYVSYQKGCYKGQEIIARMHYRGTKKYQLMTTIQHLPVAPVPNQPFYDDNHHPLGKIVDCELIQPGEYLILAIIGDQN